MHRERSKRWAGLLAALALSVSLAGPALAAGGTIPADRLAAGEAAARTLYDMGLLHGTGVDEGGSPVFSLEAVGNRADSLTMLVRLLGGEPEALSANYTHPFGDSYGWMSPYVGYAYVYGITNGTSPGPEGVYGAGTFSPAENIPCRDFVTWILRALGYANVDWASPWALAREVGLSYPESDVFYRADLAVTALSALDCRTVNGISLRQRLISSGVIPDDSPAEIPDPSEKLPDNLPDDPTDDQHNYEGEDLPDGPVDDDTQPIRFTPGPVYDYVTGVTVGDLSYLPSALAQAARGRAPSIVVSTPSGKAIEYAANLPAWEAALYDMSDVTGAVTRPVDGSHFAVDLTYSDAGQAMALLEGRLTVPGDSAASLINEAKGLLSDIRAQDGRDFSVVKAIHDYLIYTTASAEDYLRAYGELPDGVDTAAGPILYGVGDSQGLALAFRLMCYLAGVEAVPVRGQVLTDSGAVAGVWNKVKVDGGWYNIDLTLDSRLDAAGNIGYNYFLVSDAAIASTHTLTPDRPLWPASPADYAVG